MRVSPRIASAIQTGAEAARLSCGDYISSLVDSVGAPAPNRPPEPVLKAPRAWASVTQRVSAERALKRHLGRDLTDDEIRDLHPDDPRLDPNLPPLPRQRAAPPPSRVESPPPPDPSVQRGLDENARFYAERAPHRPPADDPRLLAWRKMTQWLDQQHPSWFIARPVTEEYLFEGEQDAPG